MNDFRKSFFKDLEALEKPIVLTVTATFPSLIQPWLVNLLVQLEKNGFENRVIARRSETEQISEKIIEYGLDRRYAIVPEAFDRLVREFVKGFFDKELRSWYLKGVVVYPRLLVDGELTFKEKLYAFFLLPFLGLKNVSIIHCHSEMAGNKLIGVLKAIKCPVVQTFHGLPPVGVPPISTAQRQRYTSLASAILVNTEFARSQYLSLGVDREKIKIVPQGTDLFEFSFSEKKEYEVVRILTVGRFHPDKGQKYSIEAVANLIKRGFKVSYTLVGAGPEKDSLIELCENLMVQEHVSLLSNVPDSQLRDLYRSSDIFILPSLKSIDGFHEETQGVVLQEAQARGLIVIATNAGGIPECIDDGISGFIVKDRSVKEIEEALESLLLSKDNWSDIRVRARKWVEDRFDINKIGHRITMLYRELLCR